MPALDFQSLFNASPNPYLVLDRDLNIAGANEAYLRATKRELSDIVGRWAWDAFPTDPETLKQSVASFERVIRTRQPDTMALLRFDIPRPAAEGGGFEVRYWSITHTPVLDADGEVAFVLQHPIDVTELERLRQAQDCEDTKRALEPAHSRIFDRAQAVHEANLALKADSDRLRSLFELAPSPIAVLSGPDLVIELVNEAFCRFTGRHGVAGQPLLSVFPELQGQGFRSRLQEVIATGAPYVGRDVRIALRRDPEGPVIELFHDVLYQPLFDPHGSVSGVFCQIIDVTEQHNAAQALRTANRRKDEFIAMLAHELRNPLAPIRTALKVLELEPPPEDAARARGVMGRQLNHMVRLIDDLLDIARINSSKIELKLQPASVQDLVHGAIEGSRPVIDNAGHELSVAMPEHAMQVHADPTRITQVIGNLLNNAAKYTPPGGRIEVAVEAERRCVAIHVRDNGIGIPRESLPRVFDLFSQAGRSQIQSHGGLGIGLALVKSLVELHRGSVHVASEGSGRGSAFSVRLPLAHTGDAPSPAGAADMQDDLAQAAPLKVLVVDDNVDAAQTMRLLLEMLGHDVHAVHDGFGALEVAEHLCPDIAFLDIGLPGIDGHETARRLRMTPHGRQMTLVAVTGWGSERDVALAHESGFDHHMTKPVDPLQVARVLADRSRRAD
ncbi:ATP-binding protein [Lysobacter korlensis]|uniref:histidine kinase n=1 Tax=Lysobacter korlensis TaxID=553636 RepID=A0ABV6RU09_9GAMM